MRLEIPVLTEAETKTRFIAEIVGVTPLLMHKPNLQISDGKMKRSEKKIPTPTEEAELGAYRMDDGTLMIPATWIMRNSIEAAKAFKNPTNSRQTMMKVIAAALVPPVIEGFPIFGADGKPLKEYEIDIRRAVIQRAAIMRARPKINPPWTATIEIPLDTDPIEAGELTDQQLFDVGNLMLSIMRQGGSKLGLGDYRPEKSGPFGRFSVTSFSIERDDS